MEKRLIVVGLLVCLVGGGAWASATWQSTVGNWADPNAWVEKHIPTGTDEVQIMGPNSVCTLNTSTGDWGVPATQRMRIYNGSILKVLDGGQLLGTGWMRVGSNVSMGTLIQTGGVVKVQDGGSDSTKLGIGDSAGGEGLYIISGGTMTYTSASNGILNVGARGGKGKLIIIGNAPIIAMNKLNIPEGTAGGIGTVEFRVDVNGVSPIGVKSSVTIDSKAADTTAVLVVTAIAAPPQADILLIDNRSTTVTSGIFDTVNGASAVEGASVVLTAGGWECTYALTYVGGTGNDVVLVFKSAKRVATFFSDSFDSAYDYLLEPLGAYDGIVDPNHIGVLNTSTGKAGALFMQTTGASWDPGPGPMIYKTVTGDFTATVKVVDFAGTLAAPVFHNDAGLLARDPNAAKENWVSMNYFPTWTAFLARNTINSFRNEVGQTTGTWLGSDTFAIAQKYPYIQLERKGTKFYPRISQDGVTFIPLTDPAFLGISDGTQTPLVIDRPDLPATLQVGLMNATYDVTTGSVAFDDFKITVPVPQQ